MPEEFKTVTLRLPRDLMQSMRVAAVEKEQYIWQWLADAVRLKISQEKADTDLAA